MSSSNLNRRDAIRGFAWSAALFGLSAEAVAAEAGGLPGKSLLGTDPEAFCKRLRDEQFLMPGKRAFVNTGSLGVAPRSVVQAVASHLNRAADLDLFFETLSEAAA